LQKLVMILLVGLLAAGSAYAQQENERDQQKTKQAQAVSKEVYDKIQQAQEKVDAEDYNGALKILNALNRSDKLTEYEKSNVLNYIGFVHYNMGNTKAAMAVYEEMLRIPSLEEQIRKQTVYTLAQLATMEEDYNKAIRLLDQWFTLESNPAPDPYILYAQNLYQVNRFKDMIKPIETAMEVARAREKPVKEDWYVLLNFAYLRPMIPRTRRACSNASRSWSRWLSFICSTRCPTKPRHSWMPKWRRAGWRVMPRTTGCCRRHGRWHRRTRNPFLR
jgi:outer membrane protein assembly factor BamD (BamD/ComL family)